MKENKTVANDKKVSDLLDTLGDEQLADSQTLIEIMQEITGEKPVMWGSSIIGFGTAKYKYASGREGVWMRIGFSPRKDQLSLYMSCDASQYKDLLDEMGECSHGKGCIYIKKLADVDEKVLKKLIKKAYDNDEWTKLHQDK